MSNTIHLEEDIVISNEIQNKATIERVVYLDSLKSINISKFSECSSLISTIYEYENIHYPIEDINATKSDT